MSRVRARRFGCRFVGAMLVSPLAVLILAWPAHAGGDSQLPGGTTADNLYFEPIEGLTTARHLAPRQTAIPLGLQLRLFLQAPVDAQVSMTGAIVIGRNATGVSAVCPLNQVGPLTIRGVAQMPDGTTQTSTCKLNVVAIPVSEIAVTVAPPSIAPFTLDEGATNEETMEFFFGESIAALRPVAAWGAESESGDGARRRRPRQASTSRYLTSVDRTIRMVAEVNYLQFGPIMEWRVNGSAFALGSETDRAFYHTGTHSVDVGPPANSAQLQFETYSVSIVSHSAGGGFIPENEWVTFEAVTDPPGYEEDIRWLSSTKYGTATPVLGTGPTFSCQFDDTWGDTQWLGVRADNTVFNQDQKHVEVDLIGCCEPGACCMSGGTCVVSDNPSDCLDMGGVYLGDGTTCDGGECNPPVFGMHCLFSHPGPFAPALGCPAGSCVGAAPGGPWLFCGAVVCPATPCPAGPTNLEYPCPGGPAGSKCRALAGTSHGCLCP